MKHPAILAISLLSGIVSYAQEEGYHAYEHPGYEDTPLVTRGDFPVHSDKRPLPPRVQVHPDFRAQGSPPPADATVLFDGESTLGFEANEWKIEDGLLIATKGGLRTQDAYGDFQLHLEWRTPDPALATKTGNLGNSGVYIMGKYEVQIYDSYSAKIYADGGAGAVYGQTAPAVNISRKPGEWQTYDIIWHAPVFVDGKLVKPAFVTVLHNGVVIQNHTEVLGPTGHKTAPAYEAHAPRLPFYIQAHGSPVAFRNIWIREL